VLLTVAVFTFLLLVGSVLNDIFELVASGKAPLILIGKALLLLVPFVLAFSLPIGLLTATLLLFGRLSADHELTALKASGISPLRLATPVLGFGSAMALVCAAFNLYLSPVARVEFKELRDGVLRTQGTSLLSDGRFIELGPRVTLYAQKVTGPKMSGVLIYGMTNWVTGGRTNLIRNLDVYAPEGELLFDAHQRPFRLRLQRVQGLYLSGSEWQPLFLDEYFYDIPDFRSGAQQSPKITDMTLPELLAERRRVGRDGGPVTPITVQIHRNLSFSFACLGFAMVGMPLGVRAHRRETNIGIAIALALLAIYYSFLLIGSALDTRPQFHPELIVWIPTVLFIGTGTGLLWRLNRQ
jgi:lipopolysaccharide export system permease protein